MSRRWSIDFETYSAVDLRVSGAFRYAEDPSTEALILAFSDGSFDPVAVDLTRPDAFEKLTPLFDAVERGETVSAHNVQFERLIWTKVCKFPVTPRPHQWDCTAARARMIALPGSLEGAAGALGLEFRKDPRGLELINLFSKPDRNGRRRLPADYPAEFKAFMEYCRQDVRVEMALDRVLPPLPPVEKEAFLLDYKINDRGLPVNMDLVKKAAAFVDEYSAELLRRAEEIAGCRPSQREKTLDYLRSRGFDLPNLQAATVEALAAQPGVPQDIVELIEYRIELSRAGTKKLKAIQNTVSADGRIRGGFLFSAASTRRWSSTGVQLHNLQKPSGETNPEVALSLLEDDPNDLRIMFSRPLSVIAESIRGFFESPEYFLIADYSSVEPRGLAWMVNEEWLLDAYRKKQDVYKVMAGRLYGIPPSQVNDSQRFMGKQLVLGCGYGMGAPRFRETVAKFGRQLTEEEAQEAVQGYRQSVPQITKFWRDIERACIRAVRDWRTIHLGRLVIRPDTLANGFRILFIDMPSGSIAYPNPSLGSEEWNGQIRDTFEFYTPLGSGWVKTDTFGGSLTENIIQALTRDILRDGMIAADKAGFKIVGHVHDEVIAEGDNNLDDLRELERILCESSPWAEGLPLASEGYISKRYRK